MGGCVWNLEPAVSAGRERPAGTAVPTLRPGVRRLRIRMRFNPVFARRGSGRWSPRSPRETDSCGQGTTRRGRRSPDRNTEVACE